jgi:hypothetical protein
MQFSRPLVLLVALGLGTMASAQKLPKYLHTVIIDVHANQVDQFVSLQKELNARLEKAGMPQRTTWQVVYGPTYQFRITRPVESFAELDEDGWVQKAYPDRVELANWLGRIREVQKHRELVLSRVMANLSVPAEGKEQPPYLLLNIGTNLNGKMGAYAEFLRDHIVPAYKKAGANAVTLRRHLGGNQRLWIVARGFEKYADIEDQVAIWGPVRKVLPDGKWQEVASQSGTLLASQEQIIMRRRNDLSFGGQ